MSIARRSYDEVFILPTGKWSSRSGQWVSWSLSPCFCNDLLKHWYVGYINKWWYNASFHSATKMKPNEVINVSQPLNSHLIFSVVTWWHKLRSKHVLMFLCYVSTKILPWLKIAWSNKQISIDLNKNLLPVTWFFFDYNLIDSSLLPLIAQWNWRLLHGPFMVI